MNKQEISKAIEDTRQQIYHIKEQLEENHDPAIQKRLMHQLKELQIRQMWYLDQHDAW